MSPSTFAVHDREAIAQCNVALLAEGRGVIREAYHTPTGRWSADRIAAGVSARWMRECSDRAPGRDVNHVRRLLGEQRMRLDASVRAGDPEAMQEMRSLALYECNAGKRNG